MCQQSTQVAWTLPAPEALAKRLGITAKMVRAILRTEHPGEVKRKRWESPLTLAKKVERNYKARLKEREAKKQADIEKQLEGHE